LPDPALRLKIGPKKPSEIPSNCIAMNPAFAAKRAEFSEIRFVDDIEYVVCCKIYKYL
jgi:hypothetical protein